MVTHCATLSYIPYTFIPSIHFHTLPYVLTVTHLFSVSIILFQNCVNRTALYVKWSEVQSCLTLCNPVDCSLPGFSIHGIFQARILEWVAISFSRGSSRPRNQTRVSCIAGRRFTLWASGKPLYVALTYWFLFTRRGLRHRTSLHMLTCTHIPFLVKCFRLDLVFYSVALLTALFVFFSGKLRVLYIFWIQVRYVICKYAFSICGLSF